MDAAAGRSLRVLFLDSWHDTPSRGSGTTVAIANLARGLRRLGHDVRSLAARPGLPDPVRRLVYNVGLDRRIRELAPDLVAGFDVDGSLLPSRRSYPLVVQLKGVAADEARFDRGWGRFQLRTLAALEGRNARRADRVVVPSAYSAAVACEAYGLDRSRVSVVPEALDLGPWKRLRERPPLRPDPCPTILSVARQYRRKNTRTLLDSFPSVLEAVPEARLRVVGGGPELPRLRTRVDELGLDKRVDLLGALPRADDVRAEYFRADAFCLPTLQEGFGIVLLEAMAAGLPVVAGRTGAVPEVVPDGEAGLLVDPRDPGALARAVVRVLKRPALAGRLGRAGMERVEGFTPVRTARAFLAAASELLPHGTSERRPRDAPEPEPTKEPR